MTHKQAISQLAQSIEDMREYALALDWANINAILFGDSLSDAFIIISASRPPEEESTP